METFWLHKSFSLHLKDLAAQSCFSSLGPLVELHPLPTSDLDHLTLGNAYQRLWNSKSYLIFMRSGEPWLHGNHAKCREYLRERQTGLPCDKHVNPLQVSTTLGLLCCKVMGLDQQSSMSHLHIKSTVPTSMCKGPHIAQYCDAIAAIPHIARYLLSGLSTDPK